jgi:hypothetical protein
VRSRTLLVLALLVAAAGMAHTQTPPRPTPPPEPAPQLIPPTTVPQGPRTAPELPLSERSLDQLLDRLEALRAQKAELEKQEQDVVKEIRRKAEKQSDRLQRLGVAPNEQFVPPAPATTSYAPAILPTPAGVIPAVQSLPPGAGPVVQPLAPGVPPLPTR